MQHIDGNVSFAMIVYDLRRRVRCVVAIGYSGVSFSVPPVQQSRRHGGHLPEGLSPEGPPPGKLQQLVHVTTNNGPRAERAGHQRETHGEPTSGKLRVNGGGLK